VRQQLEGWDLAFLGNSVSTDLQRLCEIGYLEVSDAAGPEAATAISDDVARVDSLAWKAIRQSLAAGQAVLVQVSSRGISQSAYCKACRERIHCAVCKGPVWLNEQGNPACRWCNAPQLATACAVCGLRDFAAGRAGSTRTVAELGKAFPGARLIEATGASAISAIEQGRTIVVATPGAEPTVPGGFGAVVLLDGQNLLMRDSLRATEEALRLWSNAAAHAAPNGRVTLTGVPGAIGQAFAVGAIRQAITRELDERRELHFPPVVRMASVVATRDLLTQLVTRLEGESGFVALGPLPIEARNMKTALEWRLLIRFPHSQTEALSSLLRQFQLEASMSTKAVNARSGRAMRPVRVRMDEVEVI
jgi:primosomal protein N' (replication factor Y)